MFGIEFIENTSEVYSLKYINVCLSLDVRALRKKNLKIFYDFIYILSVKDFRIKIFGKNFKNLFQMKMSYVLNLIKHSFSKFLAHFNFLVF